MATITLTDAQVQQIVTAAQLIQTDKTTEDAATTQANNDAAAVVTAQAAVTTAQATASGRLMRSLCLPAAESPV